MTAAWPIVRLGDLVEIKHGFAFKGEFFSEEENENVLLTPGNFQIGGGFKGGKLKYYTGPVDDEYLLNDRDLIVTMTDLSKAADTLGYPALVPKVPGKRFLHNQRLGKVLVKDSTAIHPRFLYFLLCSKSYRDEVLASVTGTTVKHTSPKKIAAFTFQLPPINIQIKIANILAAFDDKIELNRHMSKTLEATARATFQSWFVDFDPVRAKAEGRQPFGMDSETAALFPNSFDETEMGQIPQRWRIQHLTDIAKHLKVQITPNEYPEEKFDHYSIPAFDAGCRPVVNFGSEIKSNKFAVENDVVLLSKLNPDTPRVWLPQVNKTNRAICSTEFVVLKSSENCSSEYLFSLLHSSNFLRELATMVTGTSGSHQRVQPTALMNIPIILPPLKIIQNFSRFVRPLFDMRQENINQSIILKSLRDSLLPKLLSAELTPTPVA